MTLQVTERLKISGNYYTNGTAGPLVVIFFQFNAGGVFDMQISLRKGNFNAIFTKRFVYGEIEITCDRYAFVYVLDVAAQFEV